MNIAETHPAEAVGRVALFLATAVVVFLIGLFGASIIERRTEGVVAGVPGAAAAGVRAAQRRVGRAVPAPVPVVHPDAGHHLRLEVRRLAAPRHAGAAPGDGGALGRLRVRPRLQPDPRPLLRGLDVHESLRTNVDQPATCWTCKSTDVPRLMNEYGVGGFYAQTWRDLGDEVVNPIGCQDCHDPTPCGCASRGRRWSRRSSGWAATSSRRRTRRCAPWSAPSATWSTTSAGRQLPDLPVGRERRGRRRAGGVPRPRRHVDWVHASAARR
jgi:hypothetical protein